MTASDGAASGGGADDRAERAAGGAGRLGLVEAAVRRHLGVAPVRASVSFLGVEAIEILRFAAAAQEQGADELVADELGADEQVYVTLGMSRHPMAGGDTSYVEPTAPRAELVLRVRDAAGRFPDVWRSLAVLAAAPAVESVVHRPGATVDLGRPFASGSRWTGVVIRDDQMPAVDVPGWQSPVRFLQVHPATADELAWARVHGSDALLERWREAGVELTDPGRAAVALV